MLHAPAHACRLPAHALPARLAEVGSILRRDLVRASLDGATLELAFHRSAERIRDLADLIVEEGGCCSFLDFDLRIPAEGAIELRIRAPPDAPEILQAFHRAATSPEIEPAP